MPEISLPYPKQIHVFVKISINSSAIVLKNSICILYLWVYHNSFIRHLQAKARHRSRGTAGSGVAVRPGDEEDTGFCLECAKQPRNSCVAFFNYKELTQRYERMVFRANGTGRNVLSTTTASIWSNMTGDAVLSAERFLLSSRVLCQVRSGDPRICRRRVCVVPDLCVIGRVKNCSEFCWIGWCRRNRRHHIWSNCFKMI